MLWLNVVKRLANQNHVNCLFDLIGQSFMVSFDRTEKKYVLRVQRTDRNEEDNMLFSLGRSTKSFAVGLLSDQLAQPAGTVSVP